jgi:hypothetical protein
MITASIRSYTRILKKIRSGKILNKIASGKTVYFENPLECIAFKYIPGELGKFGKYYIKHPDQNEYEIDSDSNSILTAIMEGKQIRKAKYDKYHIGDDTFENGYTIAPVIHKTEGNMLVPYA